MITTDKICILVPLYKPSLDDWEYQSLKQLFNVFGNKYEICILTSRSLQNNIPSFRYIFPFSDVRFIFDDHFFLDTNEYSKLMLNIKLYTELKRYEFDYVLIYQTDCWVFRDELEYWCNKDFDYIGSPFFIRVSDKNYDNIKYNHCYNGNGGFSLRKVDSFIKNIERLNKLIVNVMTDIVPMPEDRFIAEHFHFEKHPTFTECAAFGWDGAPDILYTINDFKLPFGCHKFNIYYHSFYKKNNFIDILKDA